VRDRSRGPFAAIAIAAALAVATPARAITVVTVGKSAVLRQASGGGSALFRIGRDPAFAALDDPTCAGGGRMTLQVASYPVATSRLDALPKATLPCAGWKRQGDGYVYRDPAGATGGVQKVVYASSRFLARFGGSAYRHVPGPVGYAELWIEVGGARLNVRFHNFKTNGADRIVARRPSAAAAEGEAAFWRVLHGDDHSTAQQNTALLQLTKAVKRDKKDGWSQFLIAMMHLYRFAQATPQWDQVSADALDDMVAANDAFQKSVPLLWDGQTGDSRVPGFAAAAKFGLGVAQNDAALQAEGLADLEAAVAINAFFNVFDLIPVVQALPPTDPRFMQVFPLLKTYVSDPNTLACVASQPEICADVGLAPRNVAGALMLFGDVFVKGAGLDPANLTQAETFFYPIASVGASAVPNYRFADAVAERVGPGKAAARAALYADADPSNDPPIIGAGPQACAVCHYR
jgi:hypothetical protein